jgi:hypothetical protein
MDYFPSLCPNAQSCAAEAATAMQTGGTVWCHGNDGTCGMSLRNARSSGHAVAPTTPLILAESPRIR